MSINQSNKPTPGPWEAIGNLVRSPMHQPDGLPRGVQIVECMDGYSQPFTDEAKANAHLIAEAGTVHHETGLTPRQMFVQRNALAQMLEDLLCSDADIDRQDARRANDLLALVKGEPK